MGCRREDLRRAAADRSRARRQAAARDAGATAVRDTATGELVGYVHAAPAGAWSASVGSPGATVTFTLSGPENAGGER